MKKEPRYSLKELEAIAKSEWCFSCRDSNVLEFLQYVKTSKRIEKIFDEEAK